jgi:hypothetical protein
VETATVTSAISRQPLGQQHTPVIHVSPSQVLDEPKALGFVERNQVGRVFRSIERKLEDSLFSRPLLHQVEERGANASALM